MSPIDASSRRLAGMVVQIKRQRGEWVQPGDVVVRVVRLDRLRAEAFINAHEIGGDLVGRPVTLTVDLPGAAQSQFHGKVRVRQSGKQSGERPEPRLGRDRKPATNSPSRPIRQHDDRRIGRGQRAARTKAVHHRRRRRPLACGFARRPYPNNRPLPLCPLPPLTVRHRTSALDADAARS